MIEEIKAFSTEGKKSTVDHYMESDNVRLVIMTSTIYALLVSNGVFTEDEYNELYEAMEAKTRQDAEKELKELAEANPLYKMFV